MDLPQRHQDTELESTSTQAVEGWGAEDRSLEPVSVACSAKALAERENVAAKLPLG